MVAQAVALAGGVAEAKRSRISGPSRAPVEIGAGLRAGAALQMVLEEGGRHLHHLEGPGALRLLLAGIALGAGRDTPASAGQTLHGLRESSGPRSP